MPSLIFINNKNIYTRISLSLLFLLIPSINSIYLQNSPNLHTVVKTFFKHYHTTGDIRFERRPDGYYVGFSEIGQPLKETEQFYDYASGRYYPLNHFYTYNKDTVFLTETSWQISKNKPSPDQQAKNYLQKLGPYEIQSFARQPYYGYPRWYIDVISYLEKKEHRSESELNALARAYFQAGAGLLSNTSSHYPDDHRFDLPSGQNALTKNQLADYLYFHNKCLATYQLLIERNPDFVTPVGPVTTKYANEIMSGYLTLLFYQNEDEAKKLITTGIYEEYLLKYAKNLLESCPKDALLFTYGDSDTYPLYYVQATEGFRTDVIIVNLSLVVTPRYRSMLLSGPLGAKALKTGLPDFYYKDKYILWGKSNIDNELTYSMEEFYPLLEDQSRYYGEETPIFMHAPDNGYLIDVPKEAFLSPKAPSSTVHWLAPERQNFLMPGEIFQLDMLQANQWQRPLCFSLTTVPSDLLTWKNHLLLEGLVYRVYPDLFSSNFNNYEPDSGTINTTFNLDFWKNKMIYDTTTIITDLDKAPFYQISLVSAYKLANTLYKEEKKQQAVDHLQSIINYFPNKLKAWNGSWIMFIELLIKLDELDKAIIIANTIIDNYENNIFNDQQSYYYSTLERIRSFALDHHVEELATRCDLLLD